MLAGVYVARACTQRTGKARLTTVECACENRAFAGTNRQRRTASMSGKRLWGPWTSQRTSARPHVHSVAHSRDVCAPRFGFVQALTCGAGRRRGAQLRWSRDVRPRLAVPRPYVAAPRPGRRTRAHLAPSRALACFLGPPAAVRINRIAFTDAVHSVSSLPNEAQDWLNEVRHPARVAPPPRRGAGLTRLRHRHHSVRSTGSARPSRWTP